MRLEAVAIAGFRGFAAPVFLDLNADVVILTGPNGSGKTSFFDAILWALSGSVDRLAYESAMLVSQYSRSGEARVEVALRADDGSAIKVVRRYDGGEYLTVQRDHEVQVTGPAAEAMLIETLWPDASSAPDPLAALRHSLTRATYLQQDAVRAFVDADTEQLRFQVVGELVGVGRIAELQRQLESSRMQWSRATTVLTKDLELLESQRAGIADRLSRLQIVAGGANVEIEIRHWVNEVAQILHIDIDDVSTSTRFVERMLAELAATEQAETRRVAALERLISHLDTESPVAPEIKPLETQVAEAEARRRETSQQLAAAESEAADRRRRQVESSERSARGRALAELALDQLDDRCPVCRQEYDYEATRARLEELAVAETSSGLEAVPASDVVGLAERLASVELALSSARAALRDAIDLAQRRSAWIQIRDTLLKQADIGKFALTKDSLKQLVETSTNFSSAISELRSRGERMSLELAREAESAERADLELQLVHITDRIQEQQSEIIARHETADMSSQVIDGLREASSSVIAEQLALIEPLVQCIFSTVDPHPTFRAVNFLTGMKRGRGELWTTVNDLPSQKSVQNPSLVLSSSQLNVLALAVFLALNLAIPRLPLQVVALDDPLQSLDSVNLLGLADLLRRVRATRQIIVSTHDDRLSSLLARKLRPVASAGRTVRINLGSWTSDGPQVDVTEIPRDPNPLRLVATA